MASVIQIGNKFRVQVRRAGQPTLTKTFPNKETPCKTSAEAQKAAIAWGMAQEVAINAGKKVGVHGKTGLTIAEAIEKYLKEKKDLGKTAHDVLGWVKGGMGNVKLDKITSQDIVSYLQGKAFGPVSGAIHFSFLCSVLKMAKIGWEYHVPDIIEETRERLDHLELIGKSKERDRRPTPKEIAMLTAYDYRSEIPMADIIRFAISSAMRQAEIMRIKHATFDEEHKTVVITDRKHPKKKKGNHKVVPLLDESIEIIKRQQKKENDDNIFPFNPRSVGMYFTEACKALGIVDLHFHDLRHEGTSRLFEMGYQIHEVAMFTGHEDWKSLKRYTQLKAKDIRRLETSKAEVEKTEAPAFVMDAATMEQFKMFQAMQAMMAQQKAA